MPESQGSDLVTAEFGLGRGELLLSRRVEAELSRRDCSVPRKSERQGNMQSIYDVLFLIAVLAIVTSVYQFCPGQHMF
jgi:hypothetical protein